MNTQNKKENYAQQWNCQVIQLSCNIVWFSQSHHVIFCNFFIIPKKKCSVLVVEIILCCTDFLKVTLYICNSHLRNGTDSDETRLEGKPGSRPGALCHEGLQKTKYLESFYSRTILSHKLKTPQRSPCLSFSFLFFKSCLEITATSEHNITCIMLIIWMPSCSLTPSEYIWCMWLF